jgi:hypothetical protein
MVKLDPALQLALRQTGEGLASDAGPEPAYDLTVLVQQPLTATQVRMLTELGVAADDERTVLAGRSTRAAIEALARQRCVKQVSLAQTLDALSALAGTRLA